MRLTSRSSGIGVRVPRKRRELNATGLPSFLPLSLYPLRASLLSLQTMAVRYQSNQPVDCLGAQDLETVLRARHFYFFPTTAQPKINASIKNLVMYNGSLVRGNIQQFCPHGHISGLLWSTDLVLYALGSCHNLSLGLFSSIFL